MGLLKISPRATVLTRIASEGSNSPTALTTVVTVWGGSVYILYGGAFTRAMLVQWVLEEGEIEYEFKNIDILKGEHRAPDFLAINPAGLIPMLITPDGDTLYEVAALMLYLADRHQLSNLAPAVTDPLRGRFLSAVFCIADDIQSEMKRFHFPHRYSLRTEDNPAFRTWQRPLFSVAWTS